MSFLLEGYIYASGIILITGISLVYNGCMYTLDVDPVFDLYNTSVL